MTDAEYNQWINEFIDDLKKLNKYDEIVNTIKYENKWVGMMLINEYLGCGLNIAKGVTDYILEVPNNDE